MNGFQQFHGYRIEVNHLLFDTFQNNRTVYYLEDSKVIHVTPTMAHLLRVDADKYFRMVTKLIKVPESIFSSSWMTKMPEPINPDEFNSYPLHSLYPMEIMVSRPPCDNFYTEPTA